MTRIIFKISEAAGAAAIYDEAPGSGDPEDINALMHRPLLDPMNWLGHIYFHSDFDYFEVSHSGTPTINHASVAAGSIPSGSTLAFGWNAATTTHSLLTHSLGYVPFALVAVGSNILWPGMPIQEDANGGGRYVSAYCTTTEVRLHEEASIGASTLAAASINYTVLVFKQPPAPSGNVLAKWQGTTGALQMGYGKFDSTRRYLQVVPGGTPFGFAPGRTIDLNNGAPRAVRPDGSTYNPVPTALAAGLGRPAMIKSFARVYGSSMGYGGSFTGSTAIQVQAP